MEIIKTKKSKNTKSKHFKITSKKFTSKPTPTNKKDKTKNNIVNNISKPKYNKYVYYIKTILKKDKSEWDFKSNREYTKILENLGIYYGNLYLEQIKKQFSNFFYKYKIFLIKLCNINDLYGKTKVKKFPNFSTCSPSNFRYILHSLLILTFMSNQKLNNIDIIEIGGGYGGLSFFIHKMAHIFKINILSYTIFDLPEISLLQKSYLNALNMAKNMNFYNINYYKKLKTNSFLISNYAYSEISMTLQKEYTEKILNPYVSYGFLVWNFIKLYDFIENKTILSSLEIPDTSGNHTNYYVTFFPKDKMLN